MTQLSNGSAAPIINEHLSDTQALEVFKGLQADFEKGTPDTFLEVIKNVRKVLEGDGLRPPVTAFMEAGLLRYILYFFQPHLRVVEQYMHECTW